MAIQSNWTGGDAWNLDVFHQEYKNTGLEIFWTGSLLWELRGLFRSVGLKPVEGAEKLHLQVRLQGSSGFMQFQTLKAGPSVGTRCRNWSAKTGWFRAQNISKWPNICGSPCYWALLEGWDGATFSALRPRPGQLWPGMSKAKPPVWESAGTALRLAWLEMIWMGWTLWSPYSGMGYQKNRASNQRFLETIMNCLWFGTLLTRWLGGLQSLGSCWSQHQIWGDISIFLGFATFFLDFFGISNLSYHMFFWRYELVEILLCKWHLHSEWFHWRLFHSW